MPSTYKTPGVYVEEIRKFPPSVASVATAIPAFLGYTEKAHSGDVNLHFQAVAIKTLLEYETLFGGAPAREINTVNIDASNILTSVDMSNRFLLYDSLRIFFQNGGSKCYIISIGNYKDISGNFSLNQLIDYQVGLATSKLVDEITLMVAPDAINISPSSNIYEVQKAILEQCTNLQDRFAILDLLEIDDPSTAISGFYDGVTEFRQEIGMANLKYGAAYGPHLQVNLPISISYKNIKGKINQGGVSTPLTSLTTDPGVQSDLTKYDQLLSEIGLIETDIGSLITPETSLNQKFDQLIATASSSGAASDLDNVFSFLFDLVQAVNDWGGSTIPFSSLQIDIQDVANNTLSTHLENLLDYEQECVNASISTSAFLLANLNSWWSPLNPTTNSTITTVGEALPLLQNVYLELSQGISSIIGIANTYIEEYERHLYEEHTVYRGIVQALQSELTTLPPSAAIAGIYARVDRDRGVWKAPANVSLNGVKALTQTIDNDIQEDLNVDTTAGKSINAIRSFTGKGILVWGARTLAGNDNEWRYVPVRRFFIFAEESIQKATAAFVFESNDANTWTRVRATIENFLTLQWRDGALAGSTRDEAFYVRIGLSETMTPDDVLNGRMIVEIGMAVVRPAEFIVLRFSHKMQES